MKNGLVLERNVESFLRYDYAAIQRAVSAKRVPEFKARNGAFWKISNVAAYDILVVSKIDLNSKKGLRILKS